MMSLLYAMMMFLSPMAAGGNGHHYGWRNQAPRTVPGVTVVQAAPGSGGGNMPTQGTLPGDPTVGPRTYEQ